MSLEKICIHKQAAESQLENELKRDCEYILLLNRKITLGCMGYFNKGCYQCSGKDKNDECEDYFVLQQ